MSQLQGFWSYVHADDDADAERISRLARDVSAQFEMLTGEAPTLFLDKDAIQWGENWRDKVDSGLASVAFFVPVLTPRYFLSAECRRELQFFARQATRLGMTELVLPLLYVDLPALHDESPSDDLIKLVQAFQWEDWRELRFSDVASEPYRRGVARLAERLVKADRVVERTPPTPVTTEVISEESQDEPGTLDRLGTMEETLPRMVHTIESVGHEIESIGRIMQQGAADMERGDKQAKGFAARLLVARKVARLLSEPVDRIWSFGNDFASQLHEVDQGVRLLIERAPIEVKETPESKVQWCAFFDAVRTMAAKTGLGMSSIQGMVDGIGPLEKMSRDLRPVLRQLRRGLTAMVEAREVTEEWLQLIEGTAISCDEVPPAE